MPYQQPLVTINPENFRMRSVVCITCGFHIGAFNLKTYAGDEARIEKVMRDFHDKDAHLHQPSDVVPQEPSGVMRGGR